MIFNLKIGKKKTRREVKRGGKNLKRNHFQAQEIFIFSVNFYEFLDFVEVGTNLSRLKRVRNVDP